MINKIFLGLGYTPIEKTFNGHSGLKHIFLFAGYNDDTNTILLVDDSEDINSSILKFYDVESLLISQFNIVMCYFDPTVYYHAEFFLDRVYFKEFSPEVIYSTRYISENIHTFLSDQNINCRFINSHHEDPEGEYSYKHRQEVIKQYKTKKMTLRKYGIVNIDINDFNWDQLQILSKEKELNKINELLKLCRIYQYFYPPEDEFVIGSIAKENSTSKGIKEVAQFSKKIGHKFSDKVLIKTASKIENIESTIQILSQNGYIR